MKEYPIKTCPQCGEIVFADMDTCYGCLYTFPHENQNKTSLPTQSDPWCLEGEVPPQYLEERGYGMQDAIYKTTSSQLSSTPPIISRRTPQNDPLCTAQDTCDLSHKKSYGNASNTMFKTSSQDGWWEDQMVPTPRSIASSFSQPATPPKIKVWTPAVEFSLSLIDTSYIFGRDASCDVIISNPCVSGQHLVVGVLQGQIYAEDLHAQNPATLGGRPIKGRLTLRRGDLIHLCGTTLLIE